jgi:hypothetical protein
VCVVCVYNAGVKNLIPPWVGATNNDLSLNEQVCVCACACACACACVSVLDVATHQLP